MLVKELIKQLEQMPQKVHVYVSEDEVVDKVIFEKSPDGNGIVRIFKVWDAMHSCRKRGLNDKRRSKKSFV